MPTERDVQVRERYWCPKWYNPFRFCTRIKTVHQWCYNFSWIQETGWGFFCTLQGCENGVLYKWKAFCFNIFGSTYYYNIEKCFTSPRKASGKCASGPLG
ncbi:uncharacterized protein VTP21DRAFT_6050 [Calcarisporiella thermophila]|uniref:uncharacterized protein n=1 Tax=Calcarisporiella thermophila TaxID=911321 RepID=UPI0037442652